MDWREKLRAARAETERQIKLRNAQLRRFAADAESIGRQVYANSIRAGHRVYARTPAELRELGMAAVTGRLPQVLAQTTVRNAAPKVQAAAREAVKFTQAVMSDDPKVRAKARAEAREQVRAGVSGAVDEVTFGLADHALAATDAVREGGLWNFAENYHENIGEKRAADAHDEAHYGTARNAGRVAGFAGSLAVMGAPAVTRAAFYVLPKGAKALAAIKAGSKYTLDPRGLSQMAAAGGASAGVVEQAALDGLTGRRGTALDYVRAAAGGAIGGVGTRWAGPMLGGAAGGASDSVIGDVLSGRPVSLREALEAAHAAAALGRLGGAAGAYRASQLSPNEKGRLGETMTRIKVGARGEAPPRRFDEHGNLLRPTGEQQRLYLENGRYTVTDARGINRNGRELYFEGKMGPRAELSPRQIEAQNEYGDRYIVDGWGFDHVGRATGAVISPLGATFTDDEQFAWRR